MKKELTIRFFILYIDSLNLKYQAMKPLKKEDLDQEVFDLYDDYAHSRIERREFVNRLSKFAVGGLTVAAIMGFLMPNYAKTSLFSEADPRLVEETITYDSPKGAGMMKALLVRPKMHQGNCRE